MRPVLFRVFLAVMVSVALTATALAVPAGASASGSGWATVPSPNPLAPTGQLFWVSCPGVSTCMAVGTYVDPSGAGVSLAERWDGARWSQLPMPNPPGAAVSTPLGVSCASSSACIAVGAYLDSSGAFHMLAERWDGTTWSLQSIPDPPGAQGPFLNAVSCSSASACTAVGTFLDSSGSGETLAERWNGASWAVQSTPNPSGAQGSGFSGVSCTSSTACTAVGGSSLGTLAERWDWEWTGCSTRSRPTARQTHGMYSSCRCRRRRRCTPRTTRTTGREDCLPRADSGAAADAIVRRPTAPPG